MNKILSLTLIFLIPIMCYSQKRSKKSKNKQNAVNYLVIKAIESNPQLETNINEIKSRGFDINPEKMINELLLKELLHRDGNITVKYDFGKLDNLSKDERLLIEHELEIRSIAHAINEASKYGWKVISKNTVLILNQSRMHYILMQKQN